LYDAAVFDGKPVHAQYGTLVSVLAKWVLSALNSVGPTNFVRLAWWLFCIVGIMEMLLLYAIFRSMPPIGAVAVAAQTLAFTSLGTFSILLAPGYHFTRELVMLLPPLVIMLRHRYSENRLAQVAVTIAAIALSYTLDPTYALFAFASMTLALLVVKREVLMQWGSINKRAAVTLVALSLALIATLIIVDRSNLQYILTEALAFGRDLFWNSQRNYVIFFNFSVAFLVLAIAWSRRAATTTVYFALISVVVFLYYAITPDDFHYGKYVAYTIPFYASLGAAVYGPISNFLGITKTAIIDKLVLGLSAIFLIASLSNLASLPKFWQLRIFDSENRAYFVSRQAVINGRLLEANVNDNTIEKLRTFPKNLQYSFIVSPLDKYILFLYDRHNGFDSVDFEATMASDAALEKAEEQVTAPHQTTILDKSVLIVNPLSGILSNHPTLGAANDQSVLSIAEQIRYSELAARLLEKCGSQIIDGGDWIYIKC
jgi:hypothetical protein